jgi:hypothetical protein
MELTPFISSLLTTGHTVIKGTLTLFTNDDIEQTKELLLKYHSDDSQEMPFQPPAFSADAATWAAQYFYQSIQLTVLRDAGEEIIQQHLQPYTGQITPEAIYSADLVLRHLPSLLQLAKGLAPADPLVKELKKTAVQWPFSSVGIELDETTDDSIILQHPSLRQEYIDRIIEQKDSKRINNPNIKQYLLETTGDYLSHFWPGIDIELTTTK